MPNYDHLLRKSESEKKWLRFSPRLHNLKNRFNCQDYSILYQSEDHLLTALYRAIFETEEEITEFVAELNAMSTDELNQFLNEFMEDALQAGQWIDANVPHLDALDWSSAARAKAEREWQLIPAIEQQRISRAYQLSLAFLLASFHNYLALMVHGKKLTQLVIEAMAGSTHSFCLAVHIDKSIIDHIPYFKDRYQRAKQECDQLFLEKVGIYIAKPHWTGRIRHRLLFMLFAVLDGVSLLNHLKHKDILNICTDLEFDVFNEKIESESALSRRLAEYRSYQKPFFESMS